MNINSLSSLYPYQSPYSTTPAIQSSQPDTASDANSTSAIGSASRKNDFKSLLQDVKGGDLAAAQQDLAGLQGNGFNTQPSAAASSPLVADNQKHQDFLAMVQDIKSGNITSAKNDLSALQQDRGTQVAQNSSVTNTGEVQNPHNGHHTHKSGSGSHGANANNMNTLLQMLSASNTTAANTGQGNSSSSAGDSAQNQNGQADSYSIAAISAYQQQAASLSNTTATNFSIAA